MAEEQRRSRSPSDLIYLHDPVEEEMQEEARAETHPNTHQTNAQRRSTNQPRQPALIAADTRRAVETREVEICTICYEEFGATDTTPVFQLSCDHIFHTRCVTRWFEENATRPCPSCMQTHTGPSPAVVQATAVLFGHHMAEQRRRGIRGRPNTGRQVETGRVETRRDRDFLITTPNLQRSYRGRIATNSRGTGRPRQASSDAPRASGEQRINTLETIRSQEATVATPFRRPLALHSQSSRNRYTQDRTQMPPPSAEGEVPCYRILFPARRARDFISIIAANESGEGQYRSAEVKIEVNNSPNAVIVVKAPTKVLAIQAIVGILELTGTTDVLALRVLVYSSGVARIFGAGGHTINRIQREGLGALLQPYQAYAPRCDERILKITGTSRQIKKALEQISIYIRFRGIARVFRHYHPDRVRDRQYPVTWGGYSEEETPSNVLERSVHPQLHQHRDQNIHRVHDPERPRQTSTPIREVPHTQTSASSRSSDQAVPDRADPPSLQPITQRPTEAFQQQNTLVTEDRMLSRVQEMLTATIEPLQQRIRVLENVEELPTFLETRQREEQMEIETTQESSVGEFPSYGPFPPTNTTTPDNDNAIEVDVVADRIDTADNTQITSLVERMDKATTSAESRKKSLFFIADSHGKVDNNCTLQHYVAQLPVDIKMYEAIGGGCYHSLRQYIEQALDEARKDDVLCCYMGSNDVRDWATNRRGSNTEEQVLEELESLLQKITEVAEQKQLQVCSFIHLRRRAI